MKSRGLAHLVALGPVSMMVYYVTAKTVILQRCSEQTDLKRQDLPCTYLAHHEPACIIINIIIIIIVISIIIIIIIIICTILSGAERKQCQQGWSQDAINNALED